MTPEPGDIYLTTVSDGRHGAAKVLKVGQNPFGGNDVCLIGVLDFISDEIPNENDVKDLPIIIRKNNLAMGYSTGYPVIGIYPIKIAEELKKIGKTVVTEEESKFEIKIGTGRDGGFPLYGSTDSIGQEALIEWWFIHDLEGYKAKLQASRQQHQNMLNRKKNAT